MVMDKMPNAMLGGGTKATPHAPLANQQVEAPATPMEEKKFAEGGLLLSQILYEDAETMRIVKSQLASSEEDMFGNMVNLATTLTRQIDEEVDLPEGAILETAKTVLDQLMAIRQAMTDEKIETQDAQRIVAQTIQNLAQHYMPEDALAQRAQALGLGQQAGNAPAGSAAPRMPPATPMGMKPGGGV